MYEKEKTNVYISGFFVLISSIAQALGTFFGSFAADMIGYNWAFISGGMALILFAFTYWAVCGAGQDDQPALSTDLLTAKETPENDGPNTRGASVELQVRDSVKSDLERQELLERISATKGGTLEKSTGSTGSYEKK